MPLFALQVVGMSFVVKSAVGEWFKKKGLRVSAAFYDELDRKVSELMGAAAARAKGNNRQTVMAQDA